MTLWPGVTSELATFITMVLFFHGDRILEADSAGADLDTHGGAAAPGYRPGLSPGVGGGRRKDGGPAGRPLHLEGRAPGAVRGGTGAQDPGGAEGRGPPVREEPPCAPLTRTSWCGS